MKLIRQPTRWLRSAIESAVLPQTLHPAARRAQISHDIWR